MKRPYMILLLLVCVAFTRCSPGRKVTYEFPKDYPDAVKKDAIVLFEKGKVLYKANCSGCHGIFTKGKKDIPDFSKVQLDNYSARFLKGDPKNHAIARKMSPEQLNEVVVFLGYKKKNGTEVPAPRHTRH